MWRLAITAVCFTVAISFPAVADTRADAALNASQGAIGNSIPDLTFQSAAGSKLTLSGLRGKPLLITLIYTGCADVCPAIIENLAPAVEAAEETLGKGSFNVLTVGFDTRNDTPERMRSFARAHNAGGDNWHFVGSNKETVDRLSTAVGFDFFSSAGGFEHMAQVTILDKNGVIYEQVYGGTFGTPAIVEPLKQLILGGERSIFSLAGLGDRVKLFCTVYDPRTGRYYFNYTLPMSIFIGLGCLLAILVFLIRETRKSMHSGGV